MRLQVLNNDCNLTSKQEMLSILAAIRSIVVKNSSFQLSRQGTVLQEINNNYLAPVGLIILAAFACLSSVKAQDNSEIVNDFAKGIGPILQELSLIHI